LIVGPGELNASSFRNQFWVCYHQSHRRSSQNRMMLKNPGFARGCPGSWPDRGDSPDTPVE
jgi:hypothetical protein